MSDAAIRICPVCEGKGRQGRKVRKPCRNCSGEGFRRVPKLKRNTDG